MTGTAILLSLAVEAIAALRAKYPSLPPVYLALLSELNGWEGWVNGRYVILFDASTALTASDEYGMSSYLPGYLALGSNGGGEIIVCALDGPDDRPIFYLPAIGMSNETLFLVEPTITEFTDAVLVSARSAS